MFAIFRATSSVFVWLPVLLLIPASDVWSQEIDDNHRNLHIAMGLSHYRVVDELLASRRLQFNGNIFSSQVLFDKHSPEHTYGLLLNYGQGKLRNMSAGLDAKLYHLRAHFSYQKKVATYALFGKETRLYIGPQVGLSDYVIQNDKIIENITLTFNNTIDLCLTQQIMLNPKHMLNLQLALPLAGLIKREDYDGGTNTQLEKDFESNVLGFLFRGSKAALLNPVHQPSLRLQYIFNPENKLSWILTYQFQFLQNTQDLPIRLYENRVMLGIRFRK